MNIVSDDYCISINFFFLVGVILKFETYDLTLVERLNFVEETVKRLEHFEAINEIMNSNIINLLKKNFGLAEIKAIKNIHSDFLSEILLNVEYCSLNTVI